MPCLRVLLATAGAVATISAGSTAAANPTSSATAPADLAQQLAAVRHATARFHSVAAALRAGYQPTGACAAAPDGSGAMGYHFADPALSADPGIDPRRPELLVYERRGGGLRLVAVEYYRTDADQNLATDQDRPWLFGRPFDGPMPGHEPGAPIHYDLHAWVWKHNPAGTFAQWNPTVSCP